jgi:hypothetical protein
MVKRGTHACAGCGCNVPQKVGVPGRVRKWCPDCDPGGRYTKADAVSCKCCGAVVHQSPGRGKRRQYCSEECRIVAKKKKPIHDRVCERCGKHFTRFRESQFCSDDCRYEHRLETKPCEKCGQLFKQRNHTSRFCSNGCAASVVAKSRKPPPARRQCLCCHKPFRKRSSNRNAGKYCSRECAFEARRLRLPCARRTRQPQATLTDQIAVWFTSWGNDAADVVNSRAVSGGHKNRCIRYGCHYESFPRKLILDRDGWVCQMCGCDLLHKWTKVGQSETPHPRSPTIDHIVPLSYGPSGPGHRPDNVQAACWECNIRKSDSFAGLLPTVQYS